MPTPKNTTKRVAKSVELSNLEKLEQIRGSKAILYITGEKPPHFATQVASDILPLFKEILEKIGPGQKKISLVLNTSGGHLETPWPLVNLIREYCLTFEVIVLEKALSAGTLIALGADKVVMLPYSQLSPVDPAADIIDGGKKQVKRLEIEDIIGYIDFAKEKIGLAEQSALADIMKELTKEVGPTMLGSVNRTYALIRRIAKSLLELHKQHVSDKQSKEIIEHLTQKLFSHRHLINRREAKNTVGFGNIIEFANENTKKIADKIFDEAVELLEMKRDFDPIALLGEEQEKTVQFKRALVYSSVAKYSFKSDYLVSKVPDPSGKQQMVVNNTINKWSID
jgi:ATP-dependent protease ClpP protease subunit